MALAKSRYLKLLVLGDAGVGKTCLLNRYALNEFTVRYKATIGADFSTKQTEIDGKMVTLSLWDTAGGEGFNSLGTSFYRGSDVCVIVYDVTRAETFESAKRWKLDFITQVGLSPSDDFPFPLLANKCDLPSRVVQSTMGREFAQVSGDMLFFEVSALTADGVQTAFEAVVRKALSRPHCDEVRVNAGVFGLVKEEQTGKGGKGCC
jgi:Ras-related protein Rab-7A